VNSTARDLGSFRDPSGHVYESEGKIFRTVQDAGFENYVTVRDRGVFDALQEKNLLIGGDECDPAVVGLSSPRVRHVLEHPRIPFVSYPYEWSFSHLKEAALLHLDMHLSALELDSTLSDASAYNIQFNGSKPIFIDTLSLIPYEEGAIWAGHQQFCEQFLNPLLLRAYLGIPHNAWYRGSMEGISASDLSAILPLKKKFSWNTFAYVVLAARLQAQAISTNKTSVEAARKQSLSKSQLVGILTQLRRWIASLIPKGQDKTVWGTYAETHTYDSEEEQAKREFVARFVQKNQPDMLWDLGCNSGEYSALSLENGAKYVVGFDFDQKAVERAYARAQKHNLPFLPLFLDASNPSGGQGWRGEERKSLGARANADSVIALAFEHHLAIGRNVPLTQVVDWLVTQAPTGVIEFIEKKDPTIQQMLALREDIFADYSLETFTQALVSRARIVETKVVSKHGRRLFWYDRS